LDAIMTTQIEPPSNLFMSATAVKSLLERTVEQCSEPVIVGPFSRVVASDATRVHPKIRGTTHRKQTGRRRSLPVEQASSVVSMIEAERHKLARELHDETAQIMTATLYQIDLCLAQLAPQHRAVGTQLQSIRETLKAATREVHRLVYSLSPPILADLGLEPALRWLVVNFQTRYQVQASFTVNGIIRLPGPVEAAMFRIVQEALTNVARHANARAVTVDLRVDQQELECLVADDGNGFESRVATEPTATRFGLIGMRERASQLGGQFTVSSAPGNGTRIRVTVPLMEWRTDGENSGTPRGRP
jgi:signal transduction histidine kinase